VSEPTTWGELTPEGEAARLEALAKCLVGHIGTVWYEHPTTADVKECGGGFYPIPARPAARR